MPNTARLNRQQRRAARAKGEWTPLTRGTIVKRTEAQIAASIMQAKEMRPDMAEAEIRRIIEAATNEGSEVWKNDQYQVHVIPWEPIRINDRDAPVIQLSIRRIDRAPCRDWRDFQRIKNQLLGPEIEGIELYPAESRLTDTPNQYHIFCVNDPLFRFPFGYNAGRTVTSKSGAGSVQRPLDEEYTT